ncbi:uncharacterized protein LOC144752503 [Lissotriton helveticus]
MTHTLLKHRHRSRLRDIDALHNAEAHRQSGNASAELRTQRYKTPAIKHKSSARQQIIEGIVNKRFFLRSKGSILVHSTGTYDYPNNQNGINFLNNNLESTIVSIFNDPQTLTNLSTAVKAQVVLLSAGSVSAPITNVSDIQKYMTCNFNFADYKVTCNNQSCYCIGPCYQHPSYCTYRGDCHNRENGPVCECYTFDYYSYTGKQCELYERSAGFYGVLFGVLGAALLLLLVLILAALFFRHKKVSWKVDQRRDSRRWFTFDEEFLQFSHKDTDSPSKTSTLDIKERYDSYDVTGSLSFDSEFSAGVFQPNLESIDTLHEVKIRRPEILPTTISQ